MADLEGNTIPGPSFSEKAYVVPDELLARTAGHDQIGVTLLTGFDFAIGTPLGQVTASGKWVPYTTDAANGVGSDTCHGFLRQAVDTTSTGDVQGNMVIAGSVSYAKCLAAAATAPTSAQATLDAAVVDLGATADVLLDTIRI